MFDKNKSTIKIDHDEKCSGQALYTSDIVLDDMVYAKTLRSKHAKAKIISIYIPTLPEEYYIIDYHDILNENYVKMIFTDWPVFAQNEVNHIGEPILLVVGPKKEEIDRILEQIVVNYEVKEAVFDFSNSKIQRGFKKGNILLAQNEAAFTFKETFNTGYQEQAYIEPQGMIAYLDEEKVTIIGSMQCPYYIKNAVINTLGYPSDKVRVIQPTVGGAFGGKEEFPSITACQLAVAAIKVKKPIKMIYEREEDMLVTTKRHPSTITLEAFVNKDKQVIGLKANVALDAGAYLGLSGVVLARALLAVTNAYTIPNLDVSGDVFITNTVPNGAFRGFGSPQMIFAIEMFMHHLAKDLNLDPFAFRLKHLVKQGDLTSTSGVYRDPIIMDKMIQKAAEISNYHAKIEQFAKENTFKGIGMSWFLHGCGFTGDGESKQIKSKVRLVKDENDLVYLYIAAVEMGQGAKTILKKIVADVLDVENDQVIFDNPDTDFVPDSGPTVASRTTMIVGGLLARAAEKLKATWQKGQYQEVFEKYEQPKYIKWDEEKLHGDAYPAYSWGVNVVEVEVSPITYETKVVGVWSVYDVGKAIDERMVIGQADGGIAQGIAYGYLEYMVHENGVLKQKNMTDYIIPTSVDVAKTETIIYDNPFPFGPYGAKGVGELTLVGGAPAVALAIENAIKKKVNRIPATPEYIMELVKK